MLKHYENATYILLWALPVTTKWFSKNKQVFNEVKANLEVKSDYSFLIVK